MKVAKTEKITVKKTAKTKKINIGGKVKSVAVNVAFNPMDTYQSPHLLNLSQIRYIEKTKPSSPASGGVMEILSFEKSEILITFKFIGRLIKSALSRPFSDTQFSPKLPQTAGDNYALKQSIIWQEVSLFNFLSFIFSGVGQLLNEVLFYFQKNITSLVEVKKRLVSWLSKTEENQDEIFDFGLRPDLNSSKVIKNERVILKKKTSLSVEKSDFVDYQETRNNKNIKTKSLSVFSVMRAPLNRFYHFLEQFRFDISGTMVLKTVAVMAVLAMLFVLPIKMAGYANRLFEVKGKVLGEAEVAIKSLDQAKDQIGNLDFKQAAESFSAANNQFISAQKQLLEIKSFLTILAEAVPFSNTYKSGKNLVDLGENLSTAGEYLLNGLNTATSDTASSLTDRIKNLSSQVDLALAQFKEAQIHLDGVKDRYLPEENLATFNQLKESLPIFIQSLEQIKTASAFALNFLGDNGLKRYLFVFQNDNELRASGGFMGSFALVDFKSGAINKITMPGGGSYDVRAGFNELIKSPEPLQLVNPRWEFQDSNWWPDWPTSAKNISWFYDKSGGPTVDGVIAINSDWLASLLDIVGPIEMPDYQKTITAANYEEEIQKEVEVNFTDKAQPKKILSDLAPKLVNALMNVSPDNFFNLASAVSSGLKQKDLLVYVSNADLENWIKENGWSGAQKETNADYLLVTNTNIAGGKTDAVIKQKIYHQAEIGADGKVIDNLLISRYHFGPTEGVLTDFPNRTYFRIYVPLGSKLIKANGFISPKESEFRVPEDYLQNDARLNAENNAQIDPGSGTKIYEENGKTVFANWLVLDPGQSRDIAISYELPLTVKAAENKTEKTGIIEKIKGLLLPPDNYVSYGLVVEKQSGSDNEVQNEVVYPSSLVEQSTYPKTVKKEDNKLIFESKNLIEDQLYFVNFNTYKSTN